MLLPGAAPPALTAWAQQAGLQLAPVRPALAQWQVGLRQTSLWLHIAALRALLLLGAAVCALTLRAGAHGTDSAHALLDLLGAGPGKRAALVLCQALLLALLACLLGLAAGMVLPIGWARPGRPSCRCA